MQGSVKAEASSSAVAAGTTNASATKLKQQVAALLSKDQSAAQMARAIYKEEGIAAFWRGNLPSCMRVAGTAAINFTCMDYYKRVAVAPFLESAIVQRRSTTKTALARKRQLAASFVSGGLAGATSTTLLYPFEFLRTRLALDVGKSDTRFFTGMSDVSRKILQSDGIFGFFQGYEIALTGGIFYRVLFLGGYDAVKSELLLRKQQQQQEEFDMNLSWVERILCAQSISLTAGTLSYPFDSIRRRMMMQAGTEMSKRRYKSSIDCIRVVYGSEGLRGFFLGLGPNIVRSVGGALLLVFYDSFRTFLK